MTWLMTSANFVTLPKPVIVANWETAHPFISFGLDLSIFTSQLSTCAVYVKVPPVAFLLGCQHLTLTPSVADTFHLAQGFAPTGKCRSLANILLVCKILWSSFPLSFNLRNNKTACKRPGHAAIHARVGCRPKGSICDE